MKIFKVYKVLKNKETVTKCYLLKII